MSILGRDAGRYIRLDHPSMSLGSSGPMRTEVGKTDPDFRPRPVGFLALQALLRELEPDECEPLLWEGDQA